MLYDDELLAWERILAMITYPTSQTYLFIDASCAKSGVLAS